MNNGTILTAPLSIADVKQILGAGSFDLGTLCRHANVNKWSRFKPIDYPSIAPAANSQWWRGADGKCGFNLDNAHAATWAALQSKYTSDGKNGWNYVGTPKGGANSPYRLADFVNYKHDAQPPYSAFRIDEKVSEDGNLNAIAVLNPQSDGGESGAGEIGLKDIYSGVVDRDGNVLNLVNFYFGVGIVRLSDGANIGRVTAQSPGMTAISTPAASLNKGKYRAYPLLSKRAYSAIIGNSNSDDVFFTLPNLLPMDFEVTTASQALGLHIVLTAKYMQFTGTNTKVNIQIQLYVYTDKNKVSLTNNSLLIRFQGNSADSTLQAGEKKVVLPDIEATTEVYNFFGDQKPANIYTYNIPASDATKDFTVYALFRSGFFSAQATPLMQQ